jgi:hypothetical protein
MKGGDRNAAATQVDELVAFGPELPATAPGLACGSVKPHSFHESEAHAGFDDGVLDDAAFDDDDDDVLDDDVLDDGVPDDAIIELTAEQRKTAKMSSDQFRDLLRAAEAELEPSTAELESLDEPATRAMPPIRVRRRMGLVAPQSVEPIPAPIVLPMPDPSRTWPPTSRDQIKRQAMRPILSCAKTPSSENIPNTARARPRARKNTG